MSLTTTLPAELSPLPVEPSPPFTTGEVPWWRSVVLLAVGGLIWIFLWTKPTAVLAPEAGVVMHLPGYVSSGSGFVGFKAEVTPAELRILPKDTEFERKNYSDFPGRDRVFCGIVLSGALDQSIHRPEKCLVAQGWNIADQEDVPIKLDSGRILTVRNLTIKRNVTVKDKTITLTEYNMYWFVGQKVTTPYHYVRLFLSAWDRIVYNRANRWAYVTVSSRVDEGLYAGAEPASQTKATMVDFIRHVVPTFQKSEMPNTADAGSSAAASVARK